MKKSIRNRSHRVVYSEAKSGRYLRRDAVIYCQIETWRRSASPASDNGTNANLWTRDA